MSQLRIELSEGRAAFEPGAQLTGKVFWGFERAPRKVELRLFWYTRGTGTEEAGVVEQLGFDSPKPEEFRPFRLRLPGAAYSFSGKLISLRWALELVAAPSKQVARVEFVMAPGGQAFHLESLPKTELRSRYA